jgi:hypothetical protein
VRHPRNRRDLGPPPAPRVAGATHPHDVHAWWAGERPITVRRQADRCTGARRGRVGPPASALQRAADGPWMRSATREAGSVWCPSLPPRARRP